MMSLRPLLITVVAAFAGIEPQQPSQAASRVDYLTFAQGAVPVRVGGLAGQLGMGFEEAIQATDGNPAPFGLTLKPGNADTDAEFVYELPAPTVFDRLAVPNVRETPSPGTTFTRLVEVHGSAAGPDTGFVLLGSTILTTHKAADQVTEISVQSKTPVRWVKLRLQGGIQVVNAQTFFEFSEIIGNGTQQTPALAVKFSGAWQGRGVLIRLLQDGATVSGCYDGDGRLNGTVTGNILRGTGANLRSGVRSSFLLAVSENGSLRGLRSTNGAPFTMYTGDSTPAGAVKCPAPEPPSLGCGSVIHGINFGYDSAAILPASEPVLAMLYDGLARAAATSVLIEGHTSSEGANEYNQSLSERRAAAVVADLVRRGIGAGRLRAGGAGETRPIASNNDETGRSLNRRVEVKCQ
jgi:outer membrane protein OmpA-like peptidoglycan-associated protein